LAKEGALRSVILTTADKGAGVRSQRERRFYMRKCLHLSFYMMKYMRPSPELALKALNARHARMLSPQAGVSFGFLFGKRGSSQKCHSQHRVVKLMK
jgi:hypothetical protein